MPFSRDMTMLRRRSKFWNKFFRKTKKKTILSLKWPWKIFHEQENKKRELMKFLLLFCSTFEISEGGKTVFFWPCIFLGKLSFFLRSVYRCCWHLQVFGAAYLTDTLSSLFFFNSSRGKLLAFWNFIIDQTGFCGLKLFLFYF